MEGPFFRSRPNILFLSHPRSSGKSLACVFSGGESSDGDSKSKSAYPSEIPSASSSSFCPTILAQLIVPSLVGSSGLLAALKKETASEVKSGSETEPE